MKLKILLPFRVFLIEDEVQQIVVDTLNGSLGLLPHRLDCATVVVPGILQYENREGEVKYLALDAGILVKTEDDVTISVRNAMGGASLGELQELVKKEFLELNEREKDLRSAIAKLESDFIHQFEKFRKN